MCAVVLTWCAKNDKQPHESESDMKMTNSRIVPQQQ
jgi:hypothetical protein